MITTEELVKHILSGKKIEYDPEKHIPLLHEVLSRGDATSVFCIEAIISKETFCEWKNTYPDFKAAYNVANKAAEDVWLNMPKTHPNLNRQCWYLIMRNRFSFTKSKLKKQIAKQSKTQ